MQVLSVLPDLVANVVSFADQAPEDEDVKAGWVAFGIFIGLGVAVALLGYSLVRQLRKVDAAEEAGRYDPSDRKPVPMLPVDPAPERPATSTPADRVADPAADAGAEPDGPQRPESGPQA